MCEATPCQHRTLGHTNTCEVVQRCKLISAVFQIFWQCYTTTHHADMTSFLAIHSWNSWHLDCLAKQQISPSEKLQALFKNERTSFHDASHRRMLLAGVGNSKKKTTKPKKPSHSHLNDTKTTIFSIEWTLFKDSPLTLLDLPLT